MKKILLLTLTLTILGANLAQAMNQPKPNFLQKAINIATNTVSEIGNIPSNIAGKIENFATNAANVASTPLSKIGDFTFNFMYKYPFTTAIAIGPLVPNKVAPFRHLFKETKHRFVFLPFASLAAGIAIRANFLNIFSHQYLKENNIEHEDSTNPLLMNKCACNPKIERTK